ncbi:RWD-domain-containing protein [Pluteus cervinus]|uniref:RWD-domain-containing protein n=1 Tax=Pluteus cervinus TaxID=181527 RepID=A0ACD3B4G5_9AGAR|nr:RWD-domain-containing protein [Pluteus cervinus]
MNKIQQTECQSLQAEEKEVLKSIFPDDITFTDDLLHIEVPVELVNPVQIEVTSELPSLVLELEDGSSLLESGPSNSQPTNNTETHHISISALPPILLDIKLPSTYPLQSPPEIISINATHNWFSNIPELQDLLLRSWVAGDVVLFNWIETIHSGKFLEDLGLLTDNNTITVPAPTHEQSYTLATTLSKYNDDAHIQGFLRATYACSICMDLFKGSHCIRLSCSHVFCRPCLTEFWVISITEGDINKVACVDPECLKKENNNRALPEEVKELVTTFLYDRWKDLRQRRMAELDPTVTYCPRCEAAVWPGPEAQQADAWNKYRCCPTCSFSYCTFCLKIWHGIHTRCPIPYHLLSPEERRRSDLELLEAINKIRSQRSALAPAEISKPLTKGTLKRRQVRLNQEWIAKCTMKCPGCEVPVWRDYGCNYMKCTRCGQHFCYHCGASIDMHPEKAPCWYT